MGEPSLQKCLVLISESCRENRLETLSKKYSGSYRTSCTKMKETFFIRKYLIPKSKFLVDWCSRLSWSSLNSSTIDSTNNFKKFIDNFLQVCEFVNARRRHDHVEFVNARRLHNHVEFVNARRRHDHVESVNARRRHDHVELSTQRRRHDHVEFVNARRRH